MSSGLTADIIHDPSETAAREPSYLAPKLDLFISEFGVSDHHGGGVTLQKVLQDDIDGIGEFISVSEFGRFLPVTDRAAGRSRVFTAWLERAGVRRMIGHRTAATLNLRCVQNLYGRHIAKSLARIAPSRPLRLLTCPQGQQTVRVVELLKRRRPVKYVTWMMDDQVLRFEGGEWRYPAGYRTLFARHLQEASRVLVISPAMADFYREEFGVHCDPLFGPADPVGEPVWSVAPAGPTRLGYFGTIGPWQIDALERLAKLLPQTNAVLDIHTPVHVPEVLRLPGVSIHRPVPSADFTSRLRSYDVLVIPVSFDDSQRNLTCFGLATKMADYLASGTATIVVGPEFSAMAQFLAPHDCAWVTSADSASRLEPILREVRIGSVRRRKLANARKLVIQRFSPAAAHAVWRSAAAALVDS